MGACGWVVVTPDGTQWISGGGIVPGTMDDQSAYRSKLAGQVGIVAFLEALIFTDNPDLSITTLCDGISALQKVHLTMTNLHVDLISILSHLWYPGLHIVEQGRWWDRQDNTLSPNG